MGFDLMGRNPKNKKGEYFRNNCWWWRPLWQYVCETGILNESEMNSGNWNNGEVIDEYHALKIAERLNRDVKTGVAKKYELERTKRLKALPLETCDICNGKGKRTFEGKKQKCNGCDGKGKRKSYTTWYGFSVENVKEFAEFCKNSGGFEIC